MNRSSVYRIARRLRSVHAPRVSKPAGEPHVLLPSLAVTMDV